MKAITTEMTHFTYEKNLSKIVRPYFARWQTTSLTITFRPKN